MESQRNREICIYADILERLYFYTLLLASTAAMNLEDIENMEAGRELDALIAEKVMGWETFRSKQDYIDKGMPHIQNWEIRVEYPAYYWKEWATVVPHFSTDIVAAWQVVEKILEYEWAIPRIGIAVNHKGDPHGWYCVMTGNISATADTAPLAICRAALLAVKGVKS